jgi:hypothetical protein
LEDMVHLQRMRVSLKTIIPEDHLSFNSFTAVRMLSTDFSHTLLILFIPVSCLYVSSVKLRSDQIGNT